MTALVTPHDPNTFLTTTELKNMNRISLNKFTKVLMRDLDLAITDNICFGEEASEVILGVKPKLLKVTYYLGEEVFENIAKTCVGIGLPYRYEGTMRLRYLGAILINQWPRNRISAISTCDTILRTSTATVIKLP